MARRIVAGWSAAAACSSCRAARRRRSTRGCCCSSRSCRCRSSKPAMSRRRSPGCCCSCWRAASPAAIAPRSARRSCCCCSPPARRSSRGSTGRKRSMLGSVAIAAWSQAALFDRDSRGDWLEGTGSRPSAFAALVAVRRVRIAVASHQRDDAGRWSAIGLSRPGRRGSCAPRRRCRSPSAAASLYVLMRPPVDLRSRRDEDDDPGARSTTTRDSAPAPTR